jgi:hypothetical protein
VLVRYNADTPNFGEDGIRPRVFRFCPFLTDNQLPISSSPMQSQSYSQLVYPNSHLDQPTPDHQINSSLSDDTWHTNSLLQHENPSQPPHIYPLSTRSSDHHIAYPSLCPAFSPSNQSGTYNHHRHHNASHSATPGHHHMPPTLTPVDTTLGAGRILTRRQRALLVQNGRPLSEHSQIPVDDMDSSIVRVFFPLRLMEPDPTILPLQPRSPMYFTHPSTPSIHTPPQGDRPNI